MLLNPLPKFAETCTPALVSTPNEELELRPGPFGGYREETKSTSLLLLCVTPSVPKPLREKSTSAHADPVAIAPATLTAIGIVVFLILQSLLCAAPPQYARRIEQEGHAGKAGEADRIYRPDQSNATQKRKDCNISTTNSRQA